jgi:PadR family transcriptional regulator, regulatory protein PadR
MARSQDNVDTVRLSAIEEDILTVLLDREFYGLEILKHLNIDRGAELSFGSLYPALNRLVGKKFIRWRWGDEQDETGGARRKYYQMTSIGIQTLTNVQKYRIKLSER